MLNPSLCRRRQANEMLFCGRKLTAQEACSRGLVSQVFWPTTFNQEVMLRVKEMASCNAVVGRPHPRGPALSRVKRMTSPTFFFSSLKGFGRVQMFGEEHPHVSPGGGEWEGMPDAEAAVVFNQRTGGTFQLSAEQDVWEVNRAYDEGWGRDLKPKERLPKALCA